MESNILLVIGFATLVTSVKGIENVALGKPATQISTRPDDLPKGEANLCNDGNSNMRFHEGSCCHTLGSKAPWWRVDLQDTYLIESVAVSNRRESLLLKNLTIVVSNDASFTGGSLCSHYPGTVPEASRVVLYCAEGTTGRHVQLQITSDTGNDFYLVICEVEVYGVRSDAVPPFRGWGAKNVALQKSTVQETTYSNQNSKGSSYMAVDGNSNSDFEKGFCSHTLQTKAPWWQVDLGSFHDIYSVAITNRGYGYGQFLKNFTITVASRLRGSRKLIDERICSYQKDVIGTGDRDSFDCPVNTVGRYVQIQIFDSSLAGSKLVLCEVEVYGNPVVPPVQKVHFTRQTPSSTPSNPLVHTEKVTRLECAVLCFRRESCAAFKETPVDGGITCSLLSDIAGATYVLDKFDMTI